MSDNIPIEELSAYALYQIQQSLNEWNKVTHEYENADAQWEREGNREYNLGFRARSKYRKSKKGYSIEDEYKYLLGETDFAADFLGDHETKKGEAESASTPAPSPEADRIDQAYADGIGKVNNALDESTLGSEITEEPQGDPTDLIVEMDPVTISNPEDSVIGELKGIKQFQKSSGGGGSKSNSMRTIKNKTLNLK
tara:strand:- start:801 stop:1388 length:588 start_codon:yes stop_codon:yes gene_type:complete